MARLLTLLLFAMISLVAAAPVPREAKKPRTDYFPTQVGSKWIYKHTKNAEWQRTDVITSVEQIDDAKIIYVGTLTEDGSVEHREKMKLSPLGLFKMDLSDQETDFLTRHLKFPIHSGDEWECLMRGKMGTATCEGIEEVDVPAGRYHAVKIVARRKTETIELGEVEATGWFVLGIGPVKWGFGSGDAAEVLHSFTAGPGK